MRLNAPSEVSRSGFINCSYQHKQPQFHSQRKSTRSPKNFPFAAALLLVGSSHAFEFATAAVRCWFIVSQPLSFAWTLAPTPALNAFPMQIRKLLAGLAATFLFLSAGRSVRADSPI